MKPPPQKLAYLYSRYPVVSQTFCDSEMLALESLGYELVVGSLNPPPNSFRHGRLRDLKAEVHYPPPGEILKNAAETEGFKSALGPLLTRHRKLYPASFKPEVRARNAYHFGRLFKRLGVTHVHVHFANRATHTALFLRGMGLPFSFTAHAQDFMVDLGSDDLLRELCQAAEFVVAVSDFSKALLQKTCPDSAHKIHRIYNGIQPDNFPAASPGTGEPFQIISVGRLIEFKGFHHLVDACARLRDAGTDFRCQIIGEGPWRNRLESQISDLDLTAHVTLPGVRGQEEVKRSLAAADVFALPCIVDSKGASDILPTVITEAMACCLPVVSTQLAGVPEMVADRKTGLLVEPGDTGALAEALTYLAQNPDKAKKLGEAGRRRMGKIFAQSETAGQLAALLDEHVPKILNKSTTVQKPAELIVFTGGDRPIHRDELSAFVSAPGVAVIAAEASTAAHPADLRDAVEYLPDATVLEAAWQSDTAARDRCEELRAQIGITAIPGETFFAAARRAVHLAQILRKRPAIWHLHAARSADVPVVWLTRKLLPNIHTSFAVEENPGLPRSGLAKMLSDFGAGTYSDEKLAVMLGGKPDDALALTDQPKYRHLKFGPLKFRIKNKPPPIDRAALVREFLHTVAPTL